MFQELAFESTALGDISLRSRHDPVLGEDVYEVKLNDEYLMSSAFTAGEIALADLALNEAQAESLNVIVGGLGLGYTAAAALKDNRVQRVTVVEALPPVIDWHQRHLIPLGQSLSADPRCHFVLADFFDVATQSHGFQDITGNEVDVLLLDIDHSPRHRLLENQREFYDAASLSLVAEQLTKHGIFAIWSNDAPDDQFTDELSRSFTKAYAEQVWFENPYSGGKSSNTIYIAKR